MLSVERHGMGFPSIARINAGLAVEGLQRDLNHHIPAYRNMARLTLADWTCSLNGCIDPFSQTGIARANKIMRRNKIPTTWIIEPFIN